jgi:hypothetical protein
MLIVRMNLSPFLKSLVWKRCLKALLESLLGSPVLPDRRLTVPDRRCQEAISRFAVVWRRVLKATEESMSTASVLLFAAVPIIAALSLNMDAFVPFFILFCVIAGLTISSDGRHADAPHRDAARQDASSGLQPERRSSLPGAARPARF